MNTLLKIFFVLAIVVVIIVLMELEKNVAQVSPTQEYIEDSIEHSTMHEIKGWKNLQFDLVDPEEAPEDLRKIVEIGYRLMTQTHELLNGYVGDRLDCSSCHFGGGITTGGVNGGISLAGVAAKYPRYDEKVGAVIDLPTRVNLCFENSMNGKPLPVEGKEMEAIITYLTWISSRYPIYGNAPWLGIKPLKSKHTPNPKNGEKLYKELCMDCHGADGDGGNKSVTHPGESVPPIFGKNSFNTAAGMNHLPTFASFIYYNMPLENPSLDPSEALDIAAFVLSQPRPKKE